MSMVRQAEGKIVRCKRCFYVWRSLVEDPRVCSRCKSHKYKQYRRRNGGKNAGEKNGQWKGDGVGLGALHDYIKYHLPKPNQCEGCGEIKKLDLANISQEYKRDFSDWEWICRKCHMHKDGRAMRLRFMGHHTEESRKKISLANKGKPKSEEWKAKMRGRKHTPEQIQKMKEAAVRRWKSEEYRNHRKSPKKSNSPQKKY